MIIIIFNIYKTGHTALPSNDPSKRPLSSSYLLVHDSTGTELSYLYLYKVEAQDEVIDQFTDTTPVCASHDLCPGVAALALFKHRII